MFRHVLIVAPNFPPINTPDQHRIRMSLPYLEEFGWRATVLAVTPESVENEIDPLLMEGIPPSATIVRLNVLRPQLSRIFGFGSLAIRALPYFRGAGSRLLRQHKFDLVYFSTTQFPVMILGPVWKRKFGVPYVIDVQDPWLDDYYNRTGTPAPGGKAKHGLSQRLARLLEPRVIRDVSEVICVSPTYVELLLRRYPDLQPSQLTVLPFAAAERDFELLESFPVEQTVFDPEHGKQHWVYLGAVGLIMADTLRLFFTALRDQRTRNPERWNDVCLHFVGTSYAAAGRAEKSVEPIAAEYGVADLVEERTGRIPYFEALQTLRDADALLVVGSDSPSYSASKL